MKAVVLALGLGLLGGPALAHSEKTGTTPEDGARLIAAPDQIEMVFDDPMRITSVTLLDAEGAEMPLIRGTGLEPTLTFQAAPGPLAPGRYRVEWRGLASDGHAMQGGFSFEVID